jgi:hypothetical protein
MAGVGRWRYAAASVAGASHVRSTTECQDACAVEVFETKEGPALVLAVSDGAGSARAAAIGSRATVAGVLERAGAWFAAERTVAEITDALIRNWVEGIREEIGELACETQTEMRDYAATLLLAVLGQTHSAFAQLGDGALVALTAEQEWSWVFWPMHGEYCNTTYFIVDETAIKMLQVECQARAILEIAVFSDGLEPLVLDFKERTAFYPFFTRVFRPLRASTVDGVDVPLSRQLTEYLRSTSITARTDDDLTLVLATRVELPPSRSTPEATNSSDAGDDDHSN